MRVIKNIGFLLFFIGVFVGCSTVPIAPDPNAIEEAVAATLTAYPTPAPQIVEVTRVVVVTVAPEAPSDSATATVETTIETTTDTTEVVTDSAPIIATCPISSTNEYALISIPGPPLEHPATQHADLNLDLRGYAPTDLTTELFNIGGTDPDAPQLTGLFADGRVPEFTTAYRVHNWDWDCDEHGCRGDLLTDPEVSLLGMVTTAGETIAIPQRAPELDSAGYVAIVLYAEATRLTLGYIRENTVANGYVVHLENLCVDANLLIAYQNANVAGRADLPALRNEQVVGTAAGPELLAAVRVRGAFMEPRLRKEWWK